MKRYAGQNEVRFKVTDKQKKIFQEVSWYLYENNMIDKSNIQSFGRWRMDYVSKIYRPAVIRSDTMKQQQQNQMQQPPWLSYPKYYTSNQSQLF
jgi:RecA-family ATPase